MKIKRFFEITTFFVALSVFAGCSNIIEREEENVPEKTASNQTGERVTLKVGIDKEAVRTALPQVELEEISYINLSYNAAGSTGKDSSEVTLVGSWESVSEMEKAELPFMAGKYTFTLVAVSDNMIFREEKTYTIKVGPNNLKFAPKLEVFDNSEPYGRGNLSVSVLFNDEGIGFVTGGLYSLEGVSIPGYADQKLTIEEGGKSVYNKNNVSSGNYLLIFKFYADPEKKLLRGTYREYCSIVNKKTSTSECVVDTMGSLFTIQYNLNGGAFANGLTTAGNYTRQSSTIILPQNSESATIITKANCTFGGWYDNAEFSGNAVTELPGGSTGNKIFYARWFENTKIIFDTNATDAKISKTEQSVMKGVETNLLSASSLGLSNNKGRFLGWARDSKATKAEYSDGGAICVTENNITLYAIWSVAKINPHSESDTTDTDGDGLSDWDEINKYFTDPANSDTDGDGWSDSLEVNGLYNADYNSFNPLIADTPQLEIKMTRKPGIAYKYTISNTDSVTESQTINDGVTGSESSTNSNTKTHNETHAWSTELGISISHEWGKGGAGIHYKNVTTGSFKTAYSGNVANGDSYTYSKSASEGWSKSWSNGKSTSSSKNKSVSGGVVTIPVKFKNPSNIAYTVNNVIVALYRIPNNNAASRIFVRNLTLSSEKAFTIEPRSESGEFELIADLGIAQTEELLKWSTGFEIEVSGYKITLQKDGKNANDFTEALTEVKAKTAAIYIDWGATSGRAARTFNASVKNQYNTGAMSIDELYTKPSLDYIFHTILHYEKGKDYSLNGNGCLDKFFGIQNQIANGSYTDGSWFILHKYTENGQRYQAMYAPYTQSIDEGWSFEDIKVSAGDEISIFYSVDKDGDGVPLREEQIYGTSDDKTDDDGDGLSDYEEIYGWYKSGIGLNSKYSENFKVHTSPILPDTDGDGLLDFSTTTGERDEDPLVPKQKNDTSLGTCKFSKINANEGFTTFSFDSNGNYTIEGCNEYVWLDIQPKLAFSTIKYSLNSGGPYQDFDKTTTIPMKTEEKSVPLDVGTNRIYILCTAPDVVTTKEYTITLKSVFRTMKNFAVTIPQFAEDDLTFTWNSYADERAKSADGGYILCGIKGSVKSKNLTLANIAQAEKSIKDIKDKEEFFLALDADTLSSGRYKLSGLKQSTKYTFFLFAYAHSGKSESFTSTVLATKELTTAKSKTGTLTFYAQYMENVKSRDGGYSPQYYVKADSGDDQLKVGDISMSGNSDTPTFRIGKDDFYCFGKTEMHRDTRPEKYGACMKKFTGSYDRTKNYSFKMNFHFYEYDHSSPDDDLGTVTVSYEYDKNSDKWRVYWANHNVGNHDHYITWSETPFESTIERNDTDDGHVRMYFALRWWDE